MGGVAAVVLLACCGEKAKVSSTDGGDAGASSRVLKGITPETAVSKMLDGKAKVFEGGEYVSTQVGNAEKYLVYVTASW